MDHIHTFCAAANVISVVFSPSDDHTIYASAGKQPKKAPTFRQWHNLYLEFDNERRVLYFHRRGMYPPNLSNRQP